jgi:hypothetical protein
MHANLFESVIVTEFEAKEVNQRKQIRHQESIPGASNNYVNRAAKA